MNEDQCEGLQWPSLFLGFILGIIISLLFLTVGEQLKFNDMKDCPSEWKRAKEAHKHGFGK